jgi:aminoglycoside 6'-N-acetyltransferase I
MSVRIRPCREADLGAWTALREALWPWLKDEPDVMAPDMLSRDDMSVFLAVDADDLAIGFAEVALRRDYVNGCETSPVGFLEGIYVDPAHRLGGIARALCDEAERWSVRQGCTEFASDALLDNVESHAMHDALGFEETERVVYFRKVLPAP